jgi:hypothetical protein
MARSNRKKQLARLINALADLCLAPKRELRIPKRRIRLKSLKAFEFSVLTLTVPGLRAKNFKIFCTFNQLHHSARP